MDLLKHMKILSNKKMFCCSRPVKKDMDIDILIKELNELKDQIKVLNNAMVKNTDKFMELKFRLNKLLRLQFYRGENKVYWNSY
jgi:anion-transporting  ArsA/GET3 family ATPase